jgi:creatinine amidohydrolase/Fe(II)-dependent formamide hydrolase-like protein/fructoselysine-6-P-deglycase FrlB-like protein
MSWRDAHRLLCERAERAPDLVREAAALDLPPLPFAPRAARSFVTTGIGSSEAHAKLLAHLLAGALGLPARWAPAGAFVGPPRDVERDVLIVFSTGLSPNARLALASAAAWRSVILVSGVAPDDGAAGAEKLAALEAVRRTGGLCIRAPGGLEYGALLRVAAPLVGYAIAYRLAAAIGEAADVPVDPLRLDVDRICTRMAEVVDSAGARLAAADPLAGRVAFLASGGYGELAGNLALKLQEGLLAPRPPLWDLIGFAHGPFQEVCEQALTFLLLQRRGAPLEDELVRRCGDMLDPHRHRLLTLPSELPGPLALFEHEALLNQLVLGAIAARQIDQARWPGRLRDQPLYEVHVPAATVRVGAALGRPEAQSDTPTQRRAPPPVTRSLDRLTWPQLEALLAAGCRTAVLPLGATEQHGPHLPFATDAWIADALAERFCRRVAEAVRLPALPIGCSSEHADFPGTLSLQPDTLTAVLRDTLSSLAGHGFETVFIFSAHGGNFAALRAALPVLEAAARPARLIAFTDLDRLVAVWHQTGSTAGIDPPTAGHHAGEFETSILLGLHPDSVRRDALAPGLVDIGADPQAIFYPSVRTHSPSGVVGDPRPASAVRAERYLAAWVDALVDWYRGAKNAKNAAGTQSA